MVCAPCLIAPLALLGVGAGVSSLYYSMMTGFIITIISCLIYLYVRKIRKNNNKNCSVCKA
jgi:hypothetical protein